MSDDALGKIHDVAATAKELADAAFELAVNEGASRALVAVIDKAGKEMAVACDALQAKIEADEAALAA